MSDRYKQPHEELSVQWNEAFGETCPMCGKPVSAGLVESGRFRGEIASKTIFQYGPGKSGKGEIMVVVIHDTIREDGDLPLYIVDGKPNPLEIALAVAEDRACATDLLPMTEDTFASLKIKHTERTLEHGGNVLP